MLKRVSIQNFKSLKDVTLDLQKVNLLIGPNNSGKTNFLKALEFSCMSADSKLKNTEPILYKGAEKYSSIDLSFVLENPIPTPIPIGAKYHYYFYSIYEHDKNSFREFYGRNNQINGRLMINDIEKLNEKFNQFELSVFDDTYGGYEDYIKYVKENSEILPDTNSFLLKKIRDSLSSSDSVPFGKLFDEFISNYNFAIKLPLQRQDPFFNLRIYRIDPNLYNKPTSLNSDDYVKDNGSNLVPFLLNLGQNNKKNFKNLEEDLNKCVDEFEAIGIPIVSSKNEVKAQIKFFDKREREYWSNEVSEGVLYFLALLCIIHQPNPPKLLLLEEPERGIHPRRIWEVMKFIFQLAEERNVQIIMTTHNEHVLDAFSSMPEAVFVFDKDEDGATLVRNLQKQIIEPSHQRSRETGTKEINFTENLGENWIYGLLGGVPKDAL